MTPEVKTALDEITATFKDCELDAVEDGSGGAIVSVRNVSLEQGPFAQDDTWVGFHITHPYPYADVYPLFVRPDLSRRDGKPLGAGLSIGSFRNQPAVQISRRANKHDPAVDTVALKLCKVVRWLSTHQ